MKSTIKARAELWTRGALWYWRIITDDYRIERLTGNVTQGGARAAARYIAKKLGFRVRDWRVLNG